jgi:hypothetical protein
MLNMAIRSASTSVAQRSSGGFLSWLTGARSSALPPPDFALAGVTIPDPLPDHVEPMFLYLLSRDHHVPLEFMSTVGLFMKHLKHSVQLSC